MKCLIFKDTDETGPLDLIKSQICDNVALYAQKYDEDFEVRVDFNSKREQGWHSGESGPGLIPTWCHMWVEFVFGSCLTLRVFLRVFRA